MLNATMPAALFNTALYTQGSPDSSEYSGRREGANDNHLETRARNRGYYLGCNNTVPAARGGANQIWTSHRHDARARATR